MRTTRTSFVGELGRLLGGEDDVRVVRQHEDRAARRARSIAATSSAADGFIDCPPSTICVAPELSNSARLPAPATTATTSLSARRRVGHGVQEALLALLGLLVHVRDLDLLERADGGPERERRAGIVRVHVHLQRGRVADDEQRVAERLELSPAAPRGRARRPRRRRPCSSGTATAPGGPRRRSAPPRPAPPGSARPRARPRCRARSRAGRRRPRRRRPRCAGRRAAPACARPRRRRAARPPRAARAPSPSACASASSAISRMTVSIVPSTGFVTARVRGVARAAERSRQRRRVELARRRRRPRRSRAGSARG